jgi:biotin operon repressor
MTAIEDGARSSPEVADALGCSEWAAARALQQLRERGYVELVRSDAGQLVWQRADQEAVA